MHTENTPPNPLSVSKTTVPLVHRTSCLCCPLSLYLWGRIVCDSFRPSSEPLAPKEPRTLDQFFKTRVHIFFKSGNRTAAHFTIHKYSWNKRRSHFDMVPAQTSMDFNTILCDRATKWSTAVKRNKMMHGFPFLIQKNLIVTCICIQIWDNINIYL